MAIGTIMIVVPLVWLSKRERRKKKLQAQQEREQKEAHVT